MPDSVVDSTGTRLPTVTVKAARTSESVFAVPLAITVVGRERLENRRCYSLDEALQDVPGVVAQSRYGGSDVNENREAAGNDKDANSCRQETSGSAAIELDQVNSACFDRLLQQKSSGSNNQSTKNTSTPMYPPGSQGTPPWNATTSRIATARIPTLLLISFPIYICDDS